MKIGVLVNTIEQLDNWQLRTIDGIYNDVKLELVLLIKNDGPVDWRLNNTENLGNDKVELTGFAGLLLKCHYLLESNYLFKVSNDASKDRFNSYLHKVYSYDLKCANESSTSANANKVSNDLKNLRLDLILDVSIGVIDELFLTVSKYGVWKLLFKDYSLKNIGPVGFWEVLTKKPVIGATLLRTNLNSKDCDVIDTAFFNRHWTMTETANIVSEGSISLLFKNLKRLQNGSIEVQAIFKTRNIHDKKPSLKNVLVYLFWFFKEFFGRLKEKVMAKVFDRRYECWTIFTGSKGFFENIISSSFPLEMPKHEFWADPFLFYYDNNDYLFFENYSYKTKRGKISCGVLKGDKLTNVIDVLNFDFHLSFPFIFEENGEIYLMPESSENKKLEIFRAVDFPSKWELYSTAFDGETVADAFFHTDQQHQKWLFINKQAAISSPMNSELFIYKVDSIKLDSMVPHKQNPVLIDARVARNGGSIFEHNNQLFRPSQRNIDGIYGKALNINRIDKLTIDEYVETTVHVIEPTFDKKLMGLHHLHQCKGKFVFDAAFYSKR
jgi:hypothetical protein